MAVQLKRILPSVFELVALFVFTVVILFLGNTKDLLNYYGLDSSTQVVQQSTQHVLVNGLSILDGFSFTTRAVTFLIWAFVGMLCFSIVNSVGAAMHGIKQERELSSFRYVHPSNFTKQGFWKQVALDFLLLMATLSLTMIALYGFFAVILPIGLKFGHQLLFHTSLASVGGFLIAVAIVYVWLLLLDLCIHLITQRRRLAI